MVKHIILKCDEEMFYKLKEHKLSLEQKKKNKLTWEEYIDALFGLK